MEVLANHLLEFKSITKIFKGGLLKPDVKVLDGFTFDVREGEIIGFLGANGAGKTTLINILLGFLQITSGEIKYCGKFENFSREQMLSKIGYIPERPYVYRNQTGEEFLKFIAKLKKIKIEQLKDAIEEYGTKLKINHALDRQLKFYSKGMLQRLSFIAALINDPLLIVLDEPLSGLDPIGRRQFKSLFLELQERGKSVLFSTHVITDIEEVCTKVVALEKGRAVYHGVASELLGKYGNEEIMLSFMCGPDFAQKISQDYKKIVDNNKIYTLSLSQSELNNFIRHNSDKIEIVRVERGYGKLEDYIYG